MTSKTFSVERDESDGFDRSTHITPQFSDLDGRITVQAIIAGGRSQWLGDLDLDDLHALQAAAAHAIAMLLDEAELGGGRG